MRLPCPTPAPDGAVNKYVISSPAVNGFRALAINNNEVVTGSFNSRMVTWDANTNASNVVIDNSSTGVSINSSGVVAGISSTLSLAAAATQWNPPTYAPAQYFVGISGVSALTSNNDSNDKSGYLGAGTGFIINGADDSIVGLGSFIPNDISNTRLLAGHVGNQAAFYNANTSTLQLISYVNPGDTFSDALAVNDNGFAVGVSGPNAAFLYNSSTNTNSNINSLLGPGYEDWLVVGAYGINSSESILALGQRNGDYSVIVLNTMTAVPEPSLADVAKFPFQVSFMAMKWICGKAHKLVNGDGEAVEECKPDTLKMPKVLPPTAENKQKIQNGIDAIILREGTASQAIKNAQKALDSMKTTGK